MKQIFLDNCRTTKPIKESLDVFLSNSGPIIEQKLSYELEATYRAIYGMLSMNDEDMFVFTSSSAEAVSQVLQSVYHEAIRSGKNHIVTSALSEAGPIMAAAKLEGIGALFSMAELRNGMMTEDTLADALTPRTCIVSTPWVCGLTGVIQPIEEIVQLCRKRGVLLHVDVSHALGKILLEKEEKWPDFVTFDGDKIHAPLGTGGLFFRNTLSLNPLISGEYEQKYLRGGPLNIPLLMALGICSKEIRHLETTYCTEVARLRGIFEEGVLKGCPDAEVLFQNEERVPHITAIVFPGVFNEMLLYALYRKGLFASIGGGAFQKIDVVLEASSIPHRKAQCALSFGFSKDIDESTVQEAVVVIVEQVKKLRRLFLRLVQ